MSLNSILDTARKLGIPVIITNESGESPQVIMPFEDFASMVGMTPQKSRKSRIVSEGEETSVGIDGPSPDPDSSLTKGQKKGIASGSVHPADERFLEDHFYFEPVDDKESA